METRAARLLWPPAELSGCFFAAIHRDTRGMDLTDRDRLNFFPASPLVAATFVIEGELRLLPQRGGLEAAQSAPAQPRIFVTPAREVPTVSWSPGPLCAITVGIYPDAWESMAGSYDLPGLLQIAFECSADDVDGGWQQFCGAILPRWRALHPGSTWPTWIGTSRLADWSRGLVARAAVGGPGRSVRALERRLKKWSGQTRQSLDFYASFERLHQLSTEARGMPLANLALEAGYSDQSHMGRAVRRATGFSPRELNRLIENEEPFWCYRLLGERF
ncbi:MAG: helix-turn-helix transcriptional regulator [Hyphomicrobiaceae bacterium]|nr:helix-turn-helix transcriptional regulator [Hyphomicrobiaceae bacterium]